MRIAFILYIMAPIGFYIMWRQKQDNKKYPDTYQAHAARMEKLFKESERIEKRYGYNSQQAAAARQRIQDDSNQRRLKEENPKKDI